MDDRAGINFRDALEDAVAEFLPRVDPNMSQKRARHLAEERLREVEPRTVGGSEHILETVRSGGQIGLSFFRQVRRMIVEDKPQSTILGVVSIQVAEQGNKLPAAMAALDPTGHVARMQIQSGQNGAGPQAFVFMIAGDGADAFPAREASRAPYWRWPAPPAFHLRKP